MVNKYTKVGDLINWLCTIDPDTNVVMDTTQVDLDNMPMLVLKTIDLEKIKGYGDK